MLHSPLVHPDILQALAAAGHGSRVLIADGNYPCSTTLGPNARLVHLNLSPGLLGTTAVLEALLGAIPVEAAQVMQYTSEGPFALQSDPPIWNEYNASLQRAGSPVTLGRLERFAFYEAACQSDVALVIATGERSLWANLLLTIGVILPD